MRSLVRVGLCAGVIGLVGIVTPAHLYAQCSAGGTVSNVNDCVVPTTASVAVDCHVEWAITPQPPTIPPSTFPTGKISCIDNDPTCDADTTPGQCTFLVGACVNVTDPRLTCAPTDAASYILKHPSAKDAAKANKNPFGYENMHALVTELDSIIPSATGNNCSAQGRFVVPLKKGINKGTGKIALKATDSAMATDSDTIKFECLPNPNIATSVCASARQIASTSELIGGPLAMGKIGDYLIENDKARFIIRDTGRER